MSEVIPELAQDMPPGAGLGPPEPEGFPVAPEQEQEPQGPDLAAQLAEVQEQLEAMQAFNQSLQPVAEYLQAAPGPQQDQQPQFEFDTFADPQTQVEQLRALIRQETAPYQEVMRERELEELTGRAKDMISDIQAERGELLAPQYGEGQNGLSNDDLILQRAVEYSPSMIERYGPGIKADEAAIEMAYEELKARDEALIAAAQAQQQNQLATLAGAPREPGTTGIAAQPVVTTQPGGWEAFKARHGLS